MTRPFKIVGIGPVSLFVADLEQATRFYRDILSFTERTSVEWNGHRGVMLSASTDHHNLALYELGLRSALQAVPDRLIRWRSGFRLANYRQLRAAVAHMLARGAEEVTVPAALLPGFDYVTHLRDPDGNLVQLYYSPGGDAHRQGPRRPRSRNPRQAGRTSWTRRRVFAGQQFLVPWE